MVSNLLLTTIIYLGVLLSVLNHFVVVFKANAISIHENMPLKRSNMITIRIENVHENYPYLPRRND